LVSNELALKHFVLFGLLLPATFEGTSLTFQVAEKSGGTYQLLYDDTGTLVSLAVVQGRSYTLPAALAAWPYVKFVSNNAVAADRVLIVVKKG
jgi:hypothetical protein